MILLAVFGCVISGALLGVGYLMVYGCHGLKAGLVELDDLMEYNKLNIKDNVGAD
jgi:hypothetical protein